jgi:hypothetical protein
LVSSEVEEGVVATKLPDTFLSRIRRFREQETAGGASGQEKLMNREKNMEREIGGGF